MDDIARNAVRRILIVTPNAVVAEDLRDILTGLGGCIVDVFGSMQSTWPGPYDAAVFSVPIDELQKDARVQEMLACGARVIVLNGHLPQSTYDDTGFFSLIQPFRTEDVIALLERIGIGEGQM